MNIWIMAAEELEQASKELGQVSDQFQIRDGVKQSDPAD